LGTFISFVIDIGDCRGNTESKWVTMIVLLGIFIVLLAICWVYILAMYLGNI
jgi:hypothetical protein